MGSLADRLKQPDVSGLPDWEAASVLNSPDNSLPAIVEWLPTQIGLGSVLAKLGVIDGANFLTRIKNGAAENPVLEWGLEILRTKSFDLSDPVARQAVDGLVQDGLITSDQRDKLFSISKRERHPSWAEYNNMIGKITAREIGIARGAKP